MKNEQDEAKQASLENAADPQQQKCDYKIVTGGTEAYDPQSGLTYFYSDYNGE